MAKLFTGGFRIMLVTMLALLGWLGQQIYSKVDVAVDKITFQQTAAEIKAAADKSNTALWDSIAKTVTAQQQLTTSLSVLQAQFSAHEQEDLNTEGAEKDHEQRLRLLEKR